MGVWFGRPDNVRLVDPEELRATFANRVRERAAARGMSLNSVADRADISRPFLYDMLAGRKAPTIDTLARLAGALECRPDELLRLDRPKGA